MNARKIVVAVAPVAHMEKMIPHGVKNPVLPEDIAEQVIACAKAGLPWSICMYGHQGRASG
jgi:uncharacterized protein (DUF849 family)